MRLEDPKRAEFRSNFQIQFEYGPKMHKLAINWTTVLSRPFDNQALLKPFEYCTNAVQ